MSQYQFNMHYRPPIIINHGQHGPNSIKKLKKSIKSTLRNKKTQKLINSFEVLVNTNFKVKERFLDVRKTEECKEFHKSLV